MINVLVTGSKGQLGLALASLENVFLNYNFFFTDKSELDITNFKAVSVFISKNKIEVLINCAAYTNVDKAEDEPDLANKINHLAVKNLAEIAKKQQLKLIHISTDYVFDGNSNTPYIEKENTNPQNVYGTSKLNGERALLKVNPPNAVIIRTAWLYSSFGKNFVKTIRKLSAEKESISVISDQIGSPTYACDLAKVILQITPLIKDKGAQIYHYANGGACSWFQFAEEIVKISKNNCKIVPVTTAQFKTVAKRPKFSLLDSHKIQKIFDIKISHWKEALKICITQFK